MERAAPLPHPDTVTVFMDYDVKLPCFQRVDVKEVVGVLGALKS